MIRSQFTTFALLCACSGAFVCAESFENSPNGSVTELDSSAGRWKAEAGNAQIISGKASDGLQSLRLTGKPESEIVLSLNEVTAQGSKLAFKMERWTGRKPYGLIVEARSNGAWESVHRADDSFEVGKFSDVRVDLPAGTREVRFRSTAPADAGTLLDVVHVSRPGPMKATLVETIQPVAPVMIRMKSNPLLGFRIAVDGSEGKLTMEGVEVSLEGTSRPQDIEKLSLIASSSDPAKLSDKDAVVAETDKLGSKITFATNQELNPGDNWFWVSPALKENASIDGVIDAGVLRVKVGGKVIEPKVVSPAGAQRVGYAVRLPGDDKSKSYRIPGLVQTKKGTLIAVYDIRYNHSGDLPANIDVGAQRSTNGGQSWEKMEVAMDMGNDPKFGHDGIGDPCIFSDDVTGRVWIAALWSHGNRAWNGSGPGMKPEETGQLVLVYSDDDGKSWSKPINITEQVKNPEWKLFFNGPGTGITAKDGTLVIPAQYRDASGKPFSTLIYSKDRGKTWVTGTGIKSDTTEAQLIQLADGSIMLNCRDNRGGSRTIGVTKDLGQTWEQHPTDRKGLRESVCMASLLRWQHPKYGDLIFFSNPNTTNGRRLMTVKLSRDQAMTWPEENDRLYDARACFGYSCLAPAGPDHVGVLYEGSGAMYYLRLPLKEWFR